MSMRSSSKGASKGRGKGEEEEKPVLQFVVRDEETKEDAALNTKPYGQKAVADAPEPLPQAINVFTMTADVRFQRTMRMQDITDLKLEHQRELADFIAREAQREELRRDLLKSEPPGWRREVMKKTFLEERLAAAKALQQLKLEQEVAMTKYMRAKGLLRD